MANDRGPMLNGISWIESVLVVIAIIVRFYVRVKIIHEVRLDDWTMLGAVVRSNTSFILIRATSKMPASRSCNYSDKPS